MHRRVENDAHEWLAAMSSHIPNRGEQMVRHQGIRGLRLTLLTPARSFDKRIICGLNSSGFLGNKKGGHWASFFTIPLFLSAVNLF